MDRSRLRRHLPVARVKGALYLPPEAGPGPQAREEGRGGGGGGEAGEGEPEADHTPQHHCVFEGECGRGRARGSVHKDTHAPALPAFVSVYARAHVPVLVRACGRAGVCVRGQARCV